MMNANKPHPLKNGKGLLIDLNMPVVMLPMIVSGCSFGIIANVISPDLIIHIDIDPESSFSMESITQVLSRTSCPNI